MGEAPLALTIPATVSVTAAAIAFFGAWLAHRIASAPGWRELRWFAVGAVCAGLFNLSNLFITLDVGAAVVLAGARLSLLFGGLHAATWFFYSAALEGRRLSRTDRLLVGLGVALSALSLVPGVVIGAEPLGRDVPWLGVTYRDGPPTPVLGTFAFGYFCFVILLLLVRHARRWRAGAVDGAAHTFALAALFLGAVHDSLASAALLPTPYVLDLSLLALVLSVGVAVTRRLLASVKQLEESSAKLAQAHEELLERERLAALGELAAVVAHEVRNPLAVVFNALAGLRKQKSDGPARDALLAIVQEEAERLRDIVSDLLEFARPRPPELAPADVSPIVAGAVETARHAAGVEAGAVTLDLDGSIAPLQCDERLVRQAVINLVTNALQAPARKGPVRVVVREVDDAVAVSVADDGSGIQPDAMGRIFTPFYSTRPKGTGLGLAIVQRSAEAHGGEIDVSTTEGGGATFTLRLPRRPSRPDAR